MKKKFIWLALVLVPLCFLSACACEHEWNEANCISPQTCALCEETQGEALGHIWTDATCSIPKSCFRCKEFDGDPLGHSWIDATCSAPRTCSRCKGIDGVPLEHTWIDATCAMPKTCCVCGATEGTPLEHTFGEWEVNVEATPLTEGEKVRCCSVCQETDSKSYKMSSFVQNNKFIFTPEEFRKLFFDNFVSLGYSKFGGAQERNKDGQVVIAIIDNGYNDVGNIGFVVNKNTWEMASEKTESGFDGIVMIISAPEQFVANAIISVLMSCDPTVTEYSARELAKSVLVETTTFGDVTYSFKITGNYYMMTAVANYD